MVFLLHDINDVFMECAKMARYTDAKVAPNVIFGIFTVTWILTRLVYFPVYVLRSVWSEPIDVRPTLCDRYSPAAASDMLQALCLHDALPVLLKCICQAHNLYQLAISVP